MRNGREVRGIKGKRHRPAVDEREQLPSPTPAHSKGLWVCRATTELPCRKLFRPQIGQSEGRFPSGPTDLVAHACLVRPHLTHVDACSRHGTATDLQAGGRPCHHCILCRGWLAGPHAASLLLPSLASPVARRPPITVPGAAPHGSHLGRCDCAEDSASLFSLFLTGKLVVVPQSQNASCGPFCGRLCPGSSAGWASSKPHVTYRSVHS